ncbi:tetratricopeptide repeat protein [Actinocorallia sp. A-T 12471]|uniref:ATP-binding protein n=1 Tax=Actinocorallia sp. A-T 12471 TaxID=3089813 RepID=UPI0029CD8DDC|nr:tetratricopeptide repeat protein [Actinocorallia sp. A-T 12471]MDX6740856.1 tetratricopeptide repeat protein [Actinocorallia sp. A-T 12471]
MLEIVVGWAAQQALGETGRRVARRLTPKEHERILRRALAVVRADLPADSGRHLLAAVREELTRPDGAGWYERLGSLEAALASGLAGLTVGTYGRFRRRVSGQELLDRCGITVERLSGRLAEALEEAVRAEAIEQGGLPERLRQQEAERARSVGRAEMLPAGVSVFVDREEVFDGLDAVASAERGPGVPGLALLTGIGGIGKTCAGVRWGHTARDRFPDGRLYYDFAALNEREVSGPGDVLATFLTGLGVHAEALPAGYPARLGMFRRITADRRLLVLLDNVKLTRQVEDFLPASASSMVVATTDRPLGGLKQYGAAILPLRPLAEPDAVRLLTELAPEADPARLPELAALCGGWPLALRLAAGWIEASHGRSVDRAVERLRGDTARGTLGEEQTVDSVAEAAYTELPEAVQRAYGLLSLHPGNRPRFTRAAASALLGHDAADALDELSGRHLLEESDGRYTFHDLVRRHARRKVGDDPEAVRRLAAHYLRFTVEADATVNPGRARDAFGPLYRETPRGPSGAEDKRHALARLDAEHRNLSATVHEAAARGWNDIAWQLCEASWSLYFSLKYYDEWIATHRAGLECARGNPQAVFRVGIQLGRALYETGRFAEAHEVLDQALAAAIELRAPAHEATAVEFIGRAFEEAGRLEDALRHFQRSLALERQVPRPRGVAINLHHIGRVLLDLRELDEAGSALTASHEAFAELGDGYNRARVLHTFGRLRLASGLDPTQLYHDALALMRAEGRLFHVARILDDLAESSGDGAYAEEAREIYRRIGVS